VSAAGLDSAGVGGPRRALIIGGSMGGLFAALYLAKRGWRVDVFERIGVPLSGRGAGITTHDEMLRAIVDVAGAVPPDFGVHFEWRETVDATGATIGTMRRSQIATSWTRMWQLLRAQLPDTCYHAGRDFQCYEADGTGISAVFADGSRERGDVLIGADGFRSVVRGQFLPEAQPTYAGYVAWRGLIEEAAFSPATRYAIFLKFMFHLPDGEQVIGYPVAGTDNDLRPGHRHWNVLWYRPTDADALRRLFTDDNGTYHPLGIPPPLISRQYVAALKADAEHLPPQFREAYALVSQPILQPIYDLEPQRMVGGRVALVGDAAFVARPHLGGGVVKAAQDSEALARHLAGSAGVTDALAAYEAERQPRGRIFVRHAQELGSYIRRGYASEAEKLAAAQYRVPHSLMSETALMDWLRGAGALS
jgi:2-polyprenyl-6-methoxyphenol hydroxylase-like FAD-dependent oxidoreductase